MIEKGIFIQAYFFAFPYKKTSQNPCVIERFSLPLHRQREGVTNVSERLPDEVR